MVDRVFCKKPLDYIGIFIENRSLPVSYSSYLKPRPEVISEEGVEGIIDRANLNAGSLD